MFKSVLVSSLLVSAGLCQRSQSMWGQCGGRDYTGATACPTAAYCRNDGVNEWYSQCVPYGTEDSDTEDGGDTIITKTIGTVFSVGGPTPTVVTTFITILTPEPTPTPTSVTTITLIPDEPLSPFSPRTAGSS